MYNPYGNIYQTPYSVPYSGYMQPQGSYTGQAPFTPQNGNYATTARRHERNSQFPHAGEDFLAPGGERSAYGTAFAERADPYAY